HFAELDGEPVQVIEPERYIPLPVEDLSGVPLKERRERVRLEQRDQAAQPFDLARGPVVRMKLLQLDEKEHVLLRTMHHIVSDGWSEGIFNSELAALYEAFRDGRPV